jgi:RND family efflux transporter MFP subunit
MQKVLKYGIIALLLGAGGTLFYKKVYIPKTTYETTKSTQGNLLVEVFGIGNVGAKQIYSLTAQTGGKILTITTDEGEWVKKGDPLITLDSVDMPQLLKEATLGVEKANSEYVASQKELKSLEAQYRLTQVTYRRYAKLKSQSFASKAEYDKAKADLEVVEAQMEASRAHIASAKMEIARAKEAKAAIEEKLSRYVVYAPTSGYIIERSAQPQQTVLPSQAILKMVDPKTIWIKTYIDEKISGSVKVGQHAEITLRSQYEKRFKGVVKRIVAQSDPVTQEREVDVAFEQLPMPFYINEQAQVSIASKTYNNVVKVPAKALSFYEGKSGVWVENDSKAHFVPLEVLARGHQEVAVRGIDADEVLLLGSSSKKTLKEGMSIH